VGRGGIVSACYCPLYQFTLQMARHRRPT